VKQPRPRSRLNRQRASARSAAGSAATTRTCEDFRDDALTLDGTTGAPVDASVTVDGEPAIIKNITPEPKLLITTPNVDDAIAQLQRTTITLQAAKAVTARAKATQKTAQEAVDSAVTSVLEASRRIARAAFAVYRERSRGRRFSRGGRRCRIALSRDTSRRGCSCLRVARLGRSCATVAVR